ncbi:transposase family protein, partial [Micromonosporaceae bacterium Da 78-11]
RRYRIRMTHARSVTPLSAVLAVVVCAVVAGASSSTAITDQLHELVEPARLRLGFGDGVPAGTTMWRLLIRLDPTLLATVLAGWLHTRARWSGPPMPRRYSRVIAVDGKPCAVPDGATAVSFTCCPPGHHQRRCHFARS